MGRTNGNDGLKPFEIVIAVALMAITAAAIAPPLLKNIDEGRVSRARYDARIIADSILEFYKDTGDWPLQNDTDAAYDVTRLATNASFGGGDNGIPAGAGGVPGGGDRDSWGKTSTVTDQLIRNATDTVDPLYPESRNPQLSPGWNGPYLDSAPVDPWGNPFVVNIRFLDNGVNGHTGHAVFVLSAGPNEVFDTSFQDAMYEEQIGGDDVGCVLRPAERR